MNNFNLEMINPKKIKFKLNLYRKICGSNILIFNSVKNISNDSFTFEININDHKRIFQLNRKIENLNTFIKNGIEYYQQNYIFDDLNTEIILRYNKQLILKELVYKY